ncbi:MAG: TonB-dependent receptor [Bacteroidales bacterium]|nr:TonB-dependent receptor [Bacteroidales bacterium]
MKQVFVLLAWLCVSWHAHAQFSLNGTVTDPKNESLIGAYIVISNTYYQTVTDKNGKFSFSGIKPGTYTLEVSYVGYETHTQTLNIQTDLSISVSLPVSPVISDAVIISAVRASQNTPTTFTLMNKEEMNRKNMGQDLPYMLTLEPSVVTTSDAGAGVGYTGLRIRGSDITRINVTINGIPLNDPESHAVYWVDIPDFASSVNSLQVQRGVGSSTNGAGAFGASMNLETNSFQAKPFGQISLGAGSFSTWKTSFQAGTGLIRDHWYFEGRGSAIGSDGYIDRASSELNSFFLQGGYYNDKTLVKAVVFGGKEKTYQAWYGTDAATMAADRTFNWAGAIYDEDWNVTGFYDNQTDNYQQNHYQLHLSQRLTRALNLNLSGHFTSGRGYYEEYRQDEPFANYGLEELYFGTDTISTTDLIRRRWLDNRYYGLTWSLRYQKEKIDLILGGAYNKYDKARHFGEIIWAEFAGSGNYEEEYYNNQSFKNDFNTFIKAAWTPIPRFTLYSDMQYRLISYTAGGIESHLNPVSIDESFRFLNPKAGISYKLTAGTLYLSYSMAHREPIRDDYIDAISGEKPKPESLRNLELGIRKSDAGLQYAMNFYLMNYRNQLVLTGEINDDGAYVRKNVGKSYRTGFEVSAAWKYRNLAELSGNFSFSMNKTDYTQQDSDGEIAEYKNRDISFSPRTTAGLQFRVFPVQNLEIDWMLKYVGEQYLDNTGNRDLMLDSYLVNDLRLAYLLSGEKLPDIEFTLLVNNVFSTLYESNGYVYDGMPYYYPQAGVHFLAGLKVRF